MAYNDYGPSAIINAGVRIAAALGHANPQAVSWCKGDASHTYGYHRGAAYLKRGAYSYNLPRDVNGVDKMACSALDLGIGRADTIRVTAAMRAIWKAGKMPPVVSEFAGTLTGTITYAVDVTTGRESYGEWDNSHLDHPHISGYRDSAINAASWDLVATTIINELFPPAPSPVPPDKPPLRGRKMQLVKCAEFAQNPGVDDPIFVTDLVTARWIQDVNDLNWTIGLMQRMGFPATAWEVIDANPLKAYASVIAGFLPPGVAPDDLVQHGLGSVANMQK